jgi:hypothetical protein
VNSSVTNIKSSGNKISFDYKARSLPFPVDSIARVWENPQKQSDALEVIPFTDEFNQELLTIKGLQKNAQYNLAIDGGSIGQWDGASLSKGINLAVLSNTPQYKQAQEVAALNLQYRDIEQKMRAYYWLQFDYLKKKVMYFQDTQAALYSVNSAEKNDWAVASKKDNYQEARKKEVREKWQNEMDALIEKMYSVNQPIKHVVMVELVK